MRFYSELQIVLTRDDLTYSRVLTDKEKQQLANVDSIKFSSSELLGHISGTIEHQVANKVQEKLACIGRVVRASKAFRNSGISLQPLKTKKDKALYQKAWNKYLKETKKLQTTK